MVLRTIWDFLNPEQQEDPELVKRKLGQKARSASYRPTKKNSLKEEVDREEEPEVYREEEPEEVYTVE
jgi:hypothetical protein